MAPIEAFVRFINRPFSGGMPRAHVATAREEIDALTGFARMVGEISGEQEAIIKRGTRLASSKVRDVMRPRVDIDALDVDTPPDQVLGAVAMSGFARVPVYEGDLDDILGFVYIKDLLMELHMGRPLSLRRVLRPALLVPQTLRLDQLVEMFRQQRTQMAVVLDEHGGTEGLVTLEDVLETIVGTIHDEHRPQDADVVREGRGMLARPRITQPGPAVRYRQTSGTSPRSSRQHQHGWRAGPDATRPDRPNRRLHDLARACSGSREDGRVASRLDSSPHPFRGYEPKERPIRWSFFCVYRQCGDRQAAGEI